MESRQIAAGAHEREQRLRKNAEKARLSAEVRQTRADLARAKASRLMAVPINLGALPKRPTRSRDPNQLGG